MSLAVMDWPQCVPLVAGTSSTRLLPASAIYRSAFPDPNDRPTGSFRNEFCAALLPLQQCPAVPPGFPAMVYMSLTVMVPLPRFCPATLGISTTRLLPASAMNKFPDGSIAMFAGRSSSDEVVAPFTPASFGVPSWDRPKFPVGLPAMVYMFPAVIAMPHWPPLAAGTS